GNALHHLEDDSGRQDGKKNREEIGQAVIPGRGSAGKFTQPAQAWLRSGPGMTKRIALLRRPDRKSIRRCAGGPPIGKVPPFVIVICKSLFAHVRQQHLSPPPLLPPPASPHPFAP